MVLPEKAVYRFPRAGLILRWGLVALFTFAVPSVLVRLDKFDRGQTYTTGYLCVLRKAQQGSSPPCPA